MKKSNELERTVENINDYIEYFLQELDIEEMTELYETPEERINVFENIEMQFNNKYKPLIEKGQKMYF